MYKQNLRPYTQRLADRQIVSLEKLRDQAGISVSELMRRMIDYCLQEEEINHIVPCLSGRLYQ
jgi:hypothetical protein